MLSLDGHRKLLVWSQALLAIPRFLSGVPLLKSHSTGFCREDILPSPGSFTRTSAWMSQPLIFTLSTEGLQDVPLPLEMMAIFLTQEHVLRFPRGILTSEYESEH